MSGQGVGAYGRVWGHWKYVVGGQAYGMDGTCCRGEGIWQGMGACGRVWGHVTGGGSRVWGHVGY